MKVERYFFLCVFASQRDQGSCQFIKKDSSMCGELYALKNAVVFLRTFLQGDKCNR